MFAAMKEGWADIEENVKQIVELLNNRKLSFDEDNVLKALTVALGAKAELRAPSNSCAISLRTT